MKPSRTEFPMKSALSRRLPRFALALAACLVLPIGVAGAFEPPAAGAWSVFLHEDSWGRGESASCEDLGNAACVGSSMPSGWNDRVSSWSICNNTGEAHTFRVQLFKDNGYSNSMLDRSVTIEHGDCMTGDTPVNDALSSYKFTVSDW
jgi:hypothetical protein